MGYIETILTLRIHPIQDLFNNNMGYIETPEIFPTVWAAVGLITIWDILKRNVATAPAGAATV